VAMTDGEKGKPDMEAVSAAAGKESGRFNRRAVKVSEAQRLVLEAAGGLVCGSELVPLQAIGGRRLAQSLQATSDWPPFTRAGLDGYAVRAADTALATADEPAALRVIAAVAAGELAPAPVQPGTAARIMTGAAVPEGADAVVMLEQTAEAVLADGSAAVLIKRAAVPGQNVAPQGEELRLGSALAVPGTLLRPGHAAMLGSFGYAEVPVRKRPRVAIFATGSELLPVGAPLAAGKIRDSNSPMVAAMAEQSGAVPLLFGTLPDEPAAVAAALARIWDDADLIVTTGGVSVGDYDVMAEIMATIKRGEGMSKLFAGDMALPLGSNRLERNNAKENGGIEHAWAEKLLFDRVAMRPGSPTSAAQLGNKLLFALSGNPSACFVGFELFVRPALLRIAGASAEDVLPQRVSALLSAAIDKPSPHDRYVRSRLRFENGRLLAEPLMYAKSSMMASLAEANALAVIPGGARGALAGDLVELLLLP